MDSAKPDLPITITQPAAGRIGGLFVTAIIGAVFLFMLGAGVLVLAYGQLAGLFLVVIAGVIYVLFRYVLLDTHAKQGWRITIDAEGVDLDLPRGRSLIHRLDPVRARVDFDDIEAVEARFEAYSSFGMVCMQRVFSLRLKADDRIVLGEDRALSTALASSVLANAVQSLVQFHELPVRDLGMAEGRGGLLLVAFTTPPPWDAPAPSPERQEYLWRAARMTGSIAVASAFTPLFNPPQ